MNTSLITTLAKAKLLQTADGEQQALEIDSPWYIKMLMAASGWVAASFILGFFFTLFHRLYNNVPVLVIAGSGLIVAAYFILRSKKANEFLEHLGLAFSLAGQALLAVALLNIFKLDIFSHNSTRFSFITLSIAGMQTVLALFMPNFVHRVFSTAFAAMALGASLFYFTENTNLLALYGITIMLLTAVVWLNEFRVPKHIEKLRAVGYGLISSVIAIKAANYYFHANSWNVRSLDIMENSLWLKPWMEEILLCIIALYVVWKILQKIHPKPSQTATLLAYGGVVVITVLSFEAHGLLIGLMILLLGFAASNRVLLALGIISLLYFIGNYYYTLQNTLLDKSITLLILGVALIAGRFIMLKLLPDNLLPDNNDTNTQAVFAGER